MSSNVVRILTALCLAGALAACGDETGDTTGSGGSGTSSTTGGTTDTTATGTGGGDTTSSTTGVGGGNGTCPGATTCEATIGAFQACGGDPKGTWTVKDFCQVPSKNDPDPDCPNGKISGYVAGAQGEVTLDGTNITLTIANYDGRVDIETPRSCIMQATCDQYEMALSGQFDKTCCTEQAGVCVCNTQKTYMSPETPPQAYSTNGNNITIGQDVGEYCVKDGMLWLHTGIGMEGETVMVFQAK